MKGDVYRKGSSAWGTSIGSLRGPGPSTALVKLYDIPAPHDSDTLALFLFKEPSTATSFKNEITGTNDLTINLGTPIPGVVGPFGEQQFSGGIYSPGTTQNLRMLTAVGAFEPPNYLTLSVWVFVQTYFRPGDNDGRIISKPFRPSTWVSPYQVVHMSIAQRGANMTFDGTVAPIFVKVDHNRVPFCEWALLSLTYDGSHIRLYVNGVELGNNTLTGAIPWQTGANACPWVFGLPDPLWNEGIDLCYGPVWIEQVARSQAYLQELWRMGAKRH